MTNHFILFKRMMSENENGIILLKRIDEEGTRVEFYQLEYVCAVADRGGYNQAARHLYRVPSAVKRGVALLEQEIGLSLLQRDGRGVRLTGEGEEFVRWARSAIESRTELLDRIRCKGPLQGRVVVAAGQAILNKA